MHRPIEKQTVKFKGVNEANQYANQGNYAVKSDPKSGYQQIDIHPDHKNISGNFYGVHKYYVFAVLPFGISSVGHIFTKVIRTFVDYWRAFSFPVIVYLDDDWVFDNL